MSSEIQHEPTVSCPPIKVYNDKFANHVVVLTGAASGIGEATARLFAQQGAHVFLFDVNEDGLKRVQESITQDGGKAEIQLCDVGDEQSVKMAVEAVISKKPSIDILINIAGIFPFHPLNDFPTDLYRRTMSVNLDGTFFMIRAVLPYMQRAKYGRIINTASSTFGEPEAGLSVYMTSKAAVIGLTRATAIEAGPGVTANVVLPGLTDTPGVRAQGDPSPLFQHVMGKQVIKRTGHPLDIAHTFSFIASPEASFFTGQSFECSGGESFS